MGKRVQVQVDLQFEVDPDVTQIMLKAAAGYLSPGAAVRLDEEMDDAILEEVASEVTRVLHDGGDPGAIRGYARIKGAIEYGTMFGELRGDWLEGAE